MFLLSSNRNIEFFDFEKLKTVQDCYNQDPNKNCNSLPAINKLLLFLFEHYWDNNRGTIKYDNNTRDWILEEDIIAPQSPQLSRTQSNSTAGCPDLS